MALELVQHGRQALPRSEVVAFRARHHFFLFLFSDYHHLVRIFFFSWLLRRYVRKQKPFVINHSEEVEKYKIAQAQAAAQTKLHQNLQG